MGEGAEVEEGLGGPAAEVDGEGYAVAAEAGEDEDLFVAGMAAENGTKRFGDEDRAAPAVSDADFCKGGMHAADAGFEPAEALAGDAFAHVEAEEIAEP